MFCFIYLCIHTHTAVGHKFDTFIFRGFGECVHKSSVALDSQSRLRFLRSPLPLDTYLVFMPPNSIDEGRSTSK